MKREAMMNLQEKVAEADQSLASSKTLYDKAVEDKASQEKVDAARAEVDKAQENMALLINEYADFRELDYEYTHKYYKTNNLGMRVGDEITETVKMNISQPCMHNKRCVWKDDYYEGLGLGLCGDWETQAAAPIASPSDSSEHPVEHNGIMLTQLRAVMANVRRRCVVEGWVNNKNEPLTPETVTLYDIAKYIILPYTVETKQPFVRVLPSTTGDQPPRWFTSHWWGEPIVAFIDCIERLVIDFAPNTSDEDDRRGGGMTAHTPIWVCAYANNQWGSADAITEDPKDSSFTKAMRVASHRTVSILDEGGETFNRIWCRFEIALTFDAAEDGVWVVYTAKMHKYKSEERRAIGIVSGGAPIDDGDTDFTADREREFPFSLLAQAPRIELAEASEELDRIHILNSIVGSEQLNGTPPTEHLKYDEINDTFTQDLKYFEINDAMGKFDSGSTFTRDVFSGVVLVALFDTKKRHIVEVGTGFFIDDSSGLILTAGHIFYSLKVGTKVGPKYQGLTGAKAIIGTLPKSNEDVDSNIASFTYFATIIADDISHVDAVVLCIGSKLENPVQCPTTYLEPQAEVPIMHGKLKLEKIRKLKLTTVKHLGKEQIRIIGFNQEDKSNINHMVSFQLGYLCETILCTQYDFAGENIFSPRSEVIVMCTAFKGQSGGPCFNRCGEVIGMLSSRLGQEAHLVPSSELEPLVKKAKRRVYH